MAAEATQFPWRWDGSTISTNLDGIWGMSVKTWRNMGMIAMNLKIIWEMSAKSTESLRGPMPGKQRSRDVLTARQGPLGLATGFGHRCACTESLANQGPVWKMNAQMRNHKCLKLGGPVHGRP
jgi:hypothetical protein